uniref:Uncharacterized protein n=1 Tax=Anopheles maculatus TaxID=74869 RepID=A0A182S5Q0_9DIPT
MRKESDFLRPTNIQQLTRLAEVDGVVREFIDLELLLLLLLHTNSLLPVQDTVPTEVPTDIGRIHRVGLECRPHARPPFCLSSSRSSGSNGIVGSLHCRFLQSSEASKQLGVRMLTMTVLLLVALLAAGIRASPQGDDSAKANRNSLLLRRGNVGRPLGRTTPTTTTTTTPSSADYAEDEYAENYDEGKGDDGGEDGGEEGPAGGKQPTTTTTTTEAPKKIRPSIRPFRSNDDLLTALKKRRQESKNSKPAAGK